MQDKLINHLKTYSEVKMIAVYGSAKDNKTDKWSDIDLIIIVDDEKLEYFTQNLKWLEKVGDIYAYEKQYGENEKLLRVIFNDFTRYDLGFAKSSFFTLENLQRSNPFGNNFDIIYTKENFDGIKEKILPKITKPNYTEEFFKEKQNQFWFIAYMAYAKLKRGDYLIAIHLALELMQETMVLQMIDRDIKKDTVAHRFGDKENVLAFQDFPQINENNIEDSIKKMILFSGELFESQINIFLNEKANKFDLFKKLVEENMNC